MPIPKITRGLGTGARKVTAARANAGPSVTAEPESRRRSSTVSRASEKATIRSSRTTPARGSELPELPGGRNVARRIAAQAYWAGLLDQRERAQDPIQGHQRPALEGGRLAIPGDLPQGERHHQKRADVDGRQGKRERGRE